MTTQGNISLLDLPYHGFICSQCTKSNVIIPSLDWAVKMSHGKTPVMSTFHSEMEGAVLDMLLSGTCPVILVLGRTLYKRVPDKLKQAMDKGRLLIISVSEQERISRESAYASNKYICQNADEVTFGFLSPDSSLLHLYEERIKSNKTTNVLSQL